MSERLKWFNANRITAASLKNAARQMLQWKYSDESGWGFLLNEKRRESVQGRFIERLILKEDIIDPGGNSLHYERVLFQETHFSLQTQFPHLELRDSPRSVLTFLSQLGRAFDFGIAITPIGVDLMQLVAVLSRRLQRVTVSRMTVSDVRLSDGIVAKCVLVGEKDVREHLPKIVGSHKCKVASVGLTFTIHETELRAEMSSDGRITVAADMTDEIRREIRKFLKKAVVSQRK